MILGICLRNLYLTLWKIETADTVFSKSFKMNSKLSHECSSKTTLKRCHFIQRFLWEKWIIVSAGWEDYKHGDKIESVGTITDEFLKALKSWFNIRHQTFNGKIFLKTVNSKRRILRFCLIIERFDICSHIALEKRV